MSQQQINRISAQKYLEKAQDILQHQAHLNYLKEHFRVGNSFDKHKFIFSYLYSIIVVFFWDTSATACIPLP